MGKKEYSAGAVKHSFWFMEFRKVVALLEEGNSLEDIKQLNETNNIFGASTPRRATQIWSAVSGRIKCLDKSFCSVFQSCDVGSQKIFALVAVMVYDSLFAEFIYEVIREKMIIGSNEFSDSDIRVFFNNKQQQDEKVARWTEATTERLGKCYKTMLFEAGLTDKGIESRKILKPILDPEMEKWLINNEMQYYVKALTGVR